MLRATLAIAAAAMATAAAAAAVGSAERGSFGDRLKRNLQAAQYHWSTEHHDARNSGNSGETGPAEATGVCKTTVRRRRGWEEPGRRRL